MIDTKKVRNEKGFPGSTMVKNSACQYKKHRKHGFIPELGRFLGQPNILYWKTTWTEEPGELQSMGSQRVGRD